MALQHIRPWESDVTKVAAVRRQVFLIHFVLSGIVRGETDYREVIGVGMVLLF